MHQKKRPLTRLTPVVSKTTLNRSSADRSGGGAMRTLTWCHGRRRWLLACVLVVVLGAAGCSPTRPKPSAQPTTSTAQETPTTQAPPTTSPDPETVVRSYFAAINAHDYRKAWQLGGKNLGRSYADFVK